MNAIEAREKTRINLEKETNKHFIKANRFIERAIDDGFFHCIVPFQINKQTKEFLNTLKFEVIYRSEKTHSWTEIRW